MQVAIVSNRYFRFDYKKATCYRKVAEFSSCAFLNRYNRFIAFIVANILPLTKLGCYAQDPFGFCAAAAL